MIANVEELIEQKYELFLRVGSTLRQAPDLFKRAGDFIDEEFDQEAVLRNWDEMEDLTSDRRESLESNVGNYFARFMLAATSYLNSPPKYYCLRREGRLLHARSILLLTFIASDPEANSLNPLICELQNWAWTIDADTENDKASKGDPDDSYARHLALTTLIGFNGDRWADLVIAALKEHERDLPQDLSSDDLVPQGLHQQPRKKPKYKDVAEKLEKRIRDNNDEPMNYAALGRLFRVDRKTIKHAIEESSYLRRVYQGYPQMKKAREESLTQTVMDNHGQTRESPPNEMAVQKFIKEENQKRPQKQWQTAKAKKRSDEI